MFLSSSVRCAEEIRESFRGAFFARLQCDERVGGGRCYVGHGGSPKWRRQGERLNVRDRRNVPESKRVVAGKGPMRAAVLGPIVLSVTRGGHVDCLSMAAFVFRFSSRRAAWCTFLVTAPQEFCVFPLSCRSGRAIDMQVSVAAACGRVRSCFRSCFTEERHFDESFR